MGDNIEACNSSRTTLHQNEAAARNVRCCHTLLQLYESVKEKTRQLLAHLSISFYLILFCFLLFLLFYYFLFQSLNKISQKFLIPDFITTLWILCYMWALSKFSCVTLHTILFSKITNKDQKKWANVGSGFVLRYALVPSDFGGI